MDAGRRDRVSWWLNAAMTSALVLALVVATSALAQNTAGLKRTLATNAEERALEDRNAEVAFVQNEEKLAKASSEEEVRELAHAAEGFARARHSVSSAKLVIGFEGLGRTAEGRLETAEDTEREQGPGGKLRGVHGKSAQTRQRMNQAGCEEGVWCKDDTDGQKRGYEDDGKEAVSEGSLEESSVITQTDDEVLLGGTRAKGCGRGGASKPAAKEKSRSEAESSVWQMLPSFVRMYRFSSQREKQESRDLKNEKQVPGPRSNKTDSEPMPNNEEQGKAEHTPETALESGGKRSKCGKGGNQTSDVAFSTILYVGTSRDYEYFVATRVMIQSLLHTGTDADVVVLASEGVPQDWTATLRLDGARVLTVADVPNPYRGRAGVQPRFARALNKLLAWRLTEYARVVQLDADNLFLRNVDELFACGDFCAVFINPCIFHTGLMVLKPSLETYADMLKQLESAPSFDGADQGFLASYFPDLLDRPMFRPLPPDSARLNGTFRPLPSGSARLNGTFRPLPPGSARLNGMFRLPLGYQMDHVYYYLNFKWTLTPACAPQSVLTFPGAPVLKPWYWWSWPLLPLTLEWHKRRAETIGYDPEFYQALWLATVWFVLGMGVVSASTRAAARRSYHPRSPPGLDPGLPLSLPRSPSTFPRSNSPSRTSPSRFLLGAYFRQRLSPPLRATAIYLSLVGSALLAFWAVPTTVHPYLGWALFYLGSISLVCIIMSVNPGFPATPLAAPWVLWAIVLGVLAAPIYTAGVQKIVALCVLSAAAAAVLVESGRRILATCQKEDAEWKAQQEVGLVRWTEPEKEN